MFENAVSRIILSLAVAGSAVMAESFSTVEYVKVERSKPLYETAEERIPMEECYDVREEVRTGGNNSVGAAVVGGIIGGVLGHQIGGGRGKAAATVGGAVLGTMAGQNMAVNANASTTSGYRVVRQCETRYSYRTREVISGYVNVAKFKGKTIRVESDEPLREIPVTVTYTF